MGPGHKLCPLEDLRLYPGGPIEAKFSPEFGIFPLAGWYGRWLPTGNDAVDHAVLQRGRGL